MFDKKNKKDESEQYNKVTVDLFDEEQSQTDQEEELESLELSDKDSEKKKKFTFSFGKKKDTANDKTDKDQKVKPESDPANLYSSDDEEVLQYIDDGSVKKLSKKKIILIVAGVVVAAGLVVSLLVKNISGSSSDKVYVESVGVITGLGSANGSTNRYNGVVEAQDSWSITIQDGMSVDKCYVKVGDEVKKGDKLFKYNTEELALSRDKKQLEIDTLNNEIDTLTKNIASDEADLKSASASEKIELQTQILTNQTTIKKDQYSLKSAQTELKNLEASIKDATVKSKMDGVVKTINQNNASNTDDSDSSSDDSYDYSDYTDTGSSGDGSYMTILAVGDYRIKGTINETNVWEINEGDAVIVRSRVDNDVTWKGTISSLKTDSTASDDSESSDSVDYYDDSSSGETSSSYNFYVALNDSSDLLMGQHVLIEIDYGQDDEESALMIPSAYIHVDGEKYYVWMADNHDKLTLKEIQVGDYDEDLDEYEVTDGLSLDDFIACDDGSLKENMSVTKTDPSESTELYDETDGEYSDEEYSDEDYSDDEYSDDEYSDDEYSDDDVEYYDGEE